MVKLTGFDELSKILDGASKAINGIEEELGTVSFDPHDPASIESAIAQMSTRIDEKLGADASNPIVAQMIDGMKEAYRAGILEQAASARLEQDKT